MCSSREFIFCFTLIFLTYPDPTRASLWEEEIKASKYIAVEDAAVIYKELGIFRKGFGEHWIVMPDGDGNPVYSSMDFQRTVCDVKFEDLSESVKLILYTTEEPEGVELNVNDLKNADFNPSNPTKIIIHGWMASSNSSVIQGMKTAYLSKGDINVIGVDWNTLAGDIIYPTAVFSTKSVGTYLGFFIENLVETHNAKYSDIHIIGHSLGAHIAGFAGSSTKEKIGRITGLDPALPGFQYIQGLGGRLDESDATFVDVIHTCSGLLGMSVPAGHVDFYPNGGSPAQPGCTDVFLLTSKQACSHSKAHEFFAESISGKYNFSAIKCQDWGHFQHHKCENDYTLMGEYVSEKARGIFYLTTNDVFPFAKGFDGTIF